MFSAISEKSSLYSSSLIFSRLCRLGQVYFPIGVSKFTFVPCANNRFRFISDTVRKTISLTEFYCYCLAVLICKTQLKLTEYLYKRCPSQLCLNDNCYCIFMCSYEHRRLHNALFNMFVKRYCILHRFVFFFKQIRISLAWRGWKSEGEFWKGV